MAGPGRRGGLPSSRAGRAPAQLCLVLSWPAELPLCPSPGCVAGNCSWTAWAPWEPCSRSCGVGQQRRLRAYHPPGPGGHWCPDILTAYQEHRFCNLRACPGEAGRRGPGRALPWHHVPLWRFHLRARPCPRRLVRGGPPLPEPDPSPGPSLFHAVPGGWSRWSPWSWCDRSCGGGRSLRSRSCSSPPPKNGGAPCVGERHHVRLCNPGPCGMAVGTSRTALPTPTSNCVPATCWDGDAHWPAEKTLRPAGGGRWDLGTGRGPARGELPAPSCTRTHSRHLVHPVPGESPSPVKVFGGFEGYGRECTCTWDGAEPDRLLPASAPSELANPMDLGPSRAFQYY